MTSKFIIVVVFTNSVACVSGTGGLLPGSKDTLAFCIFMRINQLVKIRF